MPEVAYHLAKPAPRSTCVVFASPHSGREYPRAFLRQSRLNQHTVRSSEDAFVDRLFENAPKYGAPFITALAPRAYVDMNRSCEELDPALIEGVRRGGHNPRVSSGLGVIPRVVANGQAIYAGKLSAAEAAQRINTYWKPYHEALQTQLNQAFMLFGRSILVDCHSMPHEAMDTIARTGVRRPEIVLGDRFGATAGEEIIDRVEAAFKSAGLVVSRNTPFAGAYITQHYGRPAEGRHAVQIEIDRSLYMNERLVRPNGNFLAFQRVLNEVIPMITKIGRPSDRSLAAE